MSVFKKIVLTVFLLLAASVFTACSDEQEVSSDARQTENETLNFKIFRTDLSESALLNTSRFISSV